MGVLGLQGSDRGFKMTVASFFGIFFLARGLANNGYFEGLTAFLSSGSARAGLGAKNTYANRIGWLFAVIGSSWVFFAEHYLRNGRFVFVKRDHDVWRVTGKYHPKVDFRFLTDSVCWADEKVATWGRYAVLVSFVMFLHPIFPMMFARIPEEALTENYLYLYLYIFGGILAGFLMGKDTWDKSLRHYHNLYYLFCIWYWGAFFGNYLFFESVRSSYYITFHVLFCIGLMAFLVDWSTLLLFQSTGMAGALLFRKVFVGDFLPEGFTSSFAILSVVIWLICLLVAYEKGRLQRKVKERFAVHGEEQWRTSKMYEVTREQLTLNLHDKGSVLPAINKALTDLDSIKGTQPHTEIIRKAIKVMAHNSAEATSFVPVSNKEAPVKGILDNVLRYLKREGVNTDERVILQNTTGEATIIGDEYLIAKAVANGIDFMLNEKEEGKLTFSVERGHINYGPLADLPPITPAICFFLTYKEGSATTPGISSTTPFDLDNLPKELLQIKQIIQSHYGVFKKGDRFLHLVFPEDLTKVCPDSNMDPIEKLFGKASIDSKEDKAFLAAAKKAAGNFNMERIESALKACKSYHSKQKRKTGEPFYLHPVAVATILLPLTESEDVIIAALLHDVVEDTPFQLAQMDLMFGSKVSHIVKEITHLYNHDGRKIKITNKQENLENLFKNGNKESLLVKLADRLHNMRTLEGHPPAKQKAIAQETLDFFLPAAKELQQPTIGEELETRARKVIGNA